jgi:aminoglycoside phosphotransferase (APT) family kinase protein
VAGPGRVTFPAAEGRRLQWDDLPPAVRARIEGELGAPVVEAHSQSGGFSPGLAARVVSAAGGRAFVKAVSPAQNSHSPALYRREAEIAAQLPVDAPTPRLLWSIAGEQDEWVVLAFEDIDGTTPVMPWQPAELERVLFAMHDLAEALTPSPIALDPAPVLLAELFRGWAALNDDAAVQRALGLDWIAHLDELQELEVEGARVSAGETLVHLDIRADNVLLTPERVVFVDWPWAGVGARWIDLAAMLPSVAMQGGPDPDDVLGAHPVARGVAAADVDAFVAGLAGFLTHQSFLPPAPGLPTLRPFQAAQAEIARRWLASRRGWDTRA